MTRTLITFGSGPGIGNHTSADFAKKGFNHIILLSRNTQRLESEDAPFVAKASPNAKVDTLRADLSDLDSIPGVLKELDKLTEGEDVEVVFFNAARVAMGNPLETSIADVEGDFRTSNLSLILVAQHYIPKLQALAKSKPDSKPALLVTNSHLPWDPLPFMFSLSLTKAAQRNLVMSLDRAFGESGVHCGLVSVEGTVDPGNKALNPRVIAERTVGFWEGGVAAGLDVRIREE